MQSRLNEAADAGPQPLITMNAHLEERITVSQAALEAFCRRHHIQKLAFFGSVLRDDFRPEDSDIDVLVWFDREQRIGYLTIVEMEMELSSMLGRKVDLRTPEELSRHFRDDVVQNAEVMFAAA
jgi:uncharacterized protein